MQTKKIYGYQERPPKVRTVNNEPSQTQQHFANEVNINDIMRKYSQTGYLTDPTKRASRQAIFGTSVDQNMSYHDMQVKLQEIDEEFMQIPANIRKRFKNDPMELMKFLNDPENRVEAQKLGLIPCPEPEHIQKVKIIDPEPKHAQNELKTD